MTNIPRTPEEFTKIGRRFNSEDIIAEIDRLRPIATQDIADLARRGFPQPLLDRLVGYRATLAAESAERRQQRAAKRAARVSEEAAFDRGLDLLRAGTALAISAVSTRVPPEGETAEASARVMTRLAAQIDTLSGPIDEDTAALRTRLQTLGGILSDPELHPIPEMSEGIADCTTGIGQALERLPASTEAKEALQQAALVDTADLDEIDGRAYWYLKLLTQAGRARFRELQQPDRAAPYHLKALNPQGKTAKDTTTTTTT